MLLRRELNEHAGLPVEHSILQGLLQGVGHIRLLQLHYRLRENSHQAFVGSLQQEVGGVGGGHSVVKSLAIEDSFLHGIIDSHLAVGSDIKDDVFAIDPLLIDSLFQSEILLGHPPVKGLLFRVKAVLDGIPKGEGWSIDVYGDLCLVLVEICDQ